VALKDLVSDLSNFNGRSQYDGLDSQIENGVDYFPNDDAPGFTPKTDLESLYKKANSVVPPNISGFVPASDGQLSQTWGSTFPTQFKDGFLPIANAVSKYNPPKNTLTHLIEPNISSGPEESIFEPTFNLIPGKGTKQLLAIAHGSNFTSILSYFYNDKIKGLGPSKTLTIAPNLTTGPTQPLWIPGLDDVPQIPKAHGSDFMVTPIKGFISRYDGESIGAGSQTFSVARVPHTINNSLANQNANYTTAKNEGPFTGVSNFSVDTMKSIYNDSSDIEDLFKFKDGFGRDTFKNVPSGINENGNFGTTDFRTIANKGPFKGNTTHPIILRKPGSNWDNVLTESVIGGTPGNLIAGVLGVVGLLTRTSVGLADKSRVFRFMISSKGIAFVAKQFAFQALNPTLESKIYNPLSTLGIAGASDLLNGDLRGLLRAAGSFLFPTHVERHLPNPFMRGASRYEEALELTGGRLEFQSKAFGGLPPLNIPILPDGLKTGNSAADNFTQEKLREIAVKGYNAVSSATSAITFGKVNPNKYLFPISSAPKSLEGGRPSFIGGLDLAPADTLKAIEKYKLGQTQGGVTFNKQVTIMEEGRTPTSKVKTHIVDNYSLLMNKAKGDQDGHEKYFSRRNRKASKINRDIGQQKDGNGSVDKINMIPYKNDYGDLKDFIKFRFYDITNDKFIIFRAILEAITDTVTPNYSEENYIGRPDKVFVYQNVDRSISFTFSIYPKTKQEFPVLIEKLNHLVGLCYPTFSQTERMQAPFMELTMGDMFVDTPGILTGLTVTVEEASTWELDEGLQFPHFIKAACEFRHIGKYIPDATGKHYDLPSIQEVERGLTVAPQQTTAG